MNSQNRMKAAVYHKYGPPDVISIVEVEKPTRKNGEVLIQVKAASIGAYDCHLLGADPFFTRALSGLSSPRTTYWART